MNFARMSPGQDPTNSSMSSILAANDSMRATLQRDRRTVKSRTPSFRFFHRSTSASAHPTSRSLTLRSPTFAAYCALSMRPALPVRARRRGLRGVGLPCPRQKTTAETSFATTANARSISRTHVPSAPSTSSSDNNESNGTNSRTNSRVDGVNKAGSVAVKCYASRQATERGGVRIITLLTTATPAAAPLKTQTATPT